MRKTALLLFFLASLASSSDAHALIDFHAAVYPGLWKANFKQIGFGQTTEQKGDLGLGIQGAIGFTIDPIFFEYTPQAGFAYVGERTQSTGEADDMDYFSFLAGNVGVRIPIVGLSPYIGAGVGLLGFNFGTKADFSGNFLRAGLGAKIITIGAVSLRVKGEYSRIFIGDDESGDLPGSVKTRAEVYFVGVGMHVGGG